MLRVLLIRRNSISQRYWLHVLEKLPIEVCDVYRPYHIEMANLDTGGSCEIRFLGKSLSSFDKIIYTGTPIWDESNSDEVQFAFSELDASLLSALQLSGVPVFNLSMALSCNKILQLSIPFCKNLEKQGWRVPDIDYCYQDRSIHKQLTPSPEESERYILYLSKLDYFIWPNYRVIFNEHDQFVKIIEQTQLEMFRLGMDLLILQFFEHAGEFYLFSHVQELPSTDINRIAKLIYPLL